MLTQKQWKTQSLAERMQNLATCEAAEAARQIVQRQPMAKGIAVIAEETRTMANYIMETLEKNIFGGFQNEEFDMLMLKTSRKVANLALNAGLLACKEREHMPLAVFADDLRSFSIQLSEIYGNEQEYTDIPVVSPKSTVITEVVYLFSAASGKYTWWENAHLVQEVLFYDQDFIHDSRLVIKNGWRDMDMPYIKLGDVPKDPGIVIISDAFDPKKHYAVLAEFNLNALTNSHAGVSKPCSIDIPVRECWSATDGRDIVFPDWSKLSE